MKKSDLRSGDIVKIVSGEKYIVLLRTREDISSSQNMIISLNDGLYIDLDDYDEELKNEADSKYDIIAVDAEDYAGDSIRAHGLIKYRKAEEKWTWERRER